MGKKYAILHSALCDNFIRCPSMLRCQELANSSGREAAIYMDNDQKIKIRKQNCVGCEECLDRCGLFRIVTGVYMEHSCREEFANDPRNHLNLSVERFGCDIIDRENLLDSIDAVIEYVDKSDYNIRILEFVLEQAAYCPIQGIDVESVLEKNPQIKEYKKYVIPYNNGQYDPRVKAFFNNLNIGQHSFPSVAIIKDGEIRGDLIGIVRVINESARFKQQAQLIVQFQQRIKGM